MKALLIFFILFVIIADLDSQVIHSISIGPDLAFGTKSVRAANASLGGSFEYHLKLKTQVGLQFRVGVNHFKDQFGGEVSFFPVRAGIVGYLYKDLIFANIDAGISHYYSPTTTTRQTGFSFGAGGGYKIPLIDKQFVQLSVYYNLHNYRNNIFRQNYNYNWFNIRAAYGLSFGRGKNSNKEE